MNRFKTIGAVALAAVMLTACAKTATTDNGAQNETKAAAVELSAEQLDYLTTQAGLTEDSIALMDYEAINWHLLGTGMELYNKSSGVEVNGITYKNESGTDYINAVSESEEPITLDEVYAIRDKEADIRLEDFMKYSFEIKVINAEDGTYAMYVPVKDYENTYVVTAFKESDDGTVKLKVPFLSYVSSDGTNNTFSIDYDKALFDTFYENGDYSIDGKLFYGIQYSSVTDKSLVLQVFNNIDEEVSIGKGFKIYKLNGTDKELVVEDEHEIGQAVSKSSWGTRPISFGEGKTLSAGSYIIEFGDDKTGGELEFEVK